MKHFKTVHSPSTNLKYSASNSFIYCFPSPGISRPLLLLSQISFILLVFCEKESSKEFSSVFDSRRANEISSSKSCWNVAKELHYFLCCYELVFTICFRMTGIAVLLILVWMECDKLFRSNEINTMKVINSLTIHNLVFKP